MEKPVLLVAPSCDKETIEKIIQGFERKLGWRPDFDVSVDERIIGGFIAIVGALYDTSFSTKSRDDHQARRREELAHRPSFATVGTF